MWRRLRTRARRAAPAAGRIPDGGQVSYATHGEDLVARELLMRMGRPLDRGFYVDVGAFHPWNYSNTAAFYRAGWSGILVEPNPHLAELLRTERPRDIFVPAAVAEVSGTAELYVFSAWGSSNTLDPEWRDLVLSTQDVEVTETIEVRTLTLAALLDEHLPPGIAIDFLSVDVEGLDAAVLRSNDWRRHRPVLVAVEEYEMELDRPESSEIYRLLASHGYRLVSRTVLTNFYATSDT